MLGTLELVERPIVYPNTRSNITRVVEQILSIEGGFVVEMLQKGTSVSTADNQFHATFPILISGKKYSIIISGNMSLIQELGIGGRKHPFNEALYGIYTPKELTRGDLVGNNMHYSLFDTNSNKIMPTNEEFWTQLRNRIPTIHPLSLIPQN